MRATVEYVERKFEEYNQLMFGGHLPMIPIKLSDAKTFLGLCVSKVRKLKDGCKQHYDFEMRINTRIDLPETVVEDTIIHEMIHYFIGYNGLYDTSAHGAIFKSIMNSINSNFRRNISITHKTTTEQRTQAAGTKPVWHIIAVVHMHNGTTGLKVLPRYETKILDYYNIVSRAKEVESIELYLHNNPFFNQYPTSSAYKIHPIDADVLQENLLNAERFQVIKGRLVKVED